VITLYDDGPSSVNRMPIYLYTNDYPDGEIPSSQRPATADHPHRSTACLFTCTPMTTRTARYHLRSGQLPASNHPHHLTYLCELLSTLAVSAEPRKEQSRPAEGAVLNNAWVLATADNAGLFAIADKYDLPRLKGYAKARLYGQIQNCSHEDIAAVIRVDSEIAPPPHWTWKSSSMKMGCIWNNSQVSNVLVTKA